MTRCLIVYCHNLQFFAVSFCRRLGQSRWGIFHCLARSLIRFLDDWPPLNNEHCGELSYLVGNVFYNTQKTFSKELVSHHASVFSDLYDRKLKTSAPKRHIYLSLEVCDRLAAGVFVYDIRKNIKSAQSARRKKKQFLEIYAKVDCFGKLASKYLIMDWWIIGAKFKKKTTGTCWRTSTTPRNRSLEGVFFELIRSIEVSIELNYVTAR